MRDSPPRIAPAASPRPPTPARAPGGAEGRPRSSHYVHGTAPSEQRRLSLLNDLLNEASLREISIRPGERILDLGSGLGQFARAMAGAAGPEGRVIAVEASPAQRREARALARAAGEGRLVDFRAG